MANFFSVGNHDIVETMFAYVTLYSMWLQANWDRITKKYGNTQEGGFIRYVTALVSS